ncbi:sulfatase-like hydrolase/transferase [Williamsia sp. Leaf354]|uniref:sulfatase-like hydrolase/transferase n=1 Tax=Williamsia sp. Leaf354 TaxID=1736349 RepID=UPI00138F7D89|nr:sulfatase-like hydrolase/transferase [Williamsia sp. Leaf354]
MHTYFDEETIVAHYVEQGRLVTGLGGVQFFDPKPGNSLPALFPNFQYVGLASTSSMLTPREEQDLPSFVMNEALTHDLLGDAIFFAFANFSETHFPYSIPSTTRRWSEVSEVLEDYLRCQSLVRSGETARGLSVASAGLLKQMQVDALEQVDKNLGRLFSELERRGRRTLVIVCADHGESFGEEGRLGHGHPGPEVTTVPMWVGRVGV